MNNHLPKVLLIMFSLLAFAGLHAAGYKGPDIRNTINNRPVKFVENKGQICDALGKPVPSVWFKAEAPGVDLYITDQGLTYVFIKYKEEEDKNEQKMEEKSTYDWEKVEMILKDADLKKENIVTAEPSAYHSNYFLSNFLSDIKNVREYESITIRDIYPGIDWVLYNSASTGFKYDFIIHPGADPNKISMEYHSLSKVNLTKAGGLSLKTEYGALVENAPYSYIEETAEKIKSNFIIKQERSGKFYKSIVNFQLVTAEISKTLIIDPQLIWSTFFGGNSYDGIASTDTDGSGNVFACGYSSSNTFPFLNSGTYFQGAGTGNQFAFLIKFSVTGALLWSTFYGGNTYQNAYSVECDNSGNVFMCGTSGSSNFPVLNSIGAYFQNPAGGDDAFMVKFDNTGNRLWATAYGGSGNDIARSLAIDNNGNVWMTGTTNSSGFPVQNTSTYFDGTYSGTLSGFLVKFNNQGARLFATYYDNVTPQSIETDITNNVYVTGYSYSLMPVFNPGGGSYFNGNAIAANDAFILKFDQLGTRKWATYYGGTASDEGRSLVTDSKGNLFVAGVCSSTNFPTQNSGTYYDGINGGNGYTDAFFLKFDSTGVRKWATLYGGSKSEGMSFDNLVCDDCDNFYCSFETRSSDLTTQISCDGGYFDAFLDTTSASYDIVLTKFNNKGNLLWATYLGGDGADFRSPIDLDINKDLIIAGEWANATPATYPLVWPGGNAYRDTTVNGLDDSFMAKFHTGTPGVASFSYASACSNYSGTLSPQLSNIDPGGVFKGFAGLALDTLTGKIIPSLSAPGFYVITYSAPACVCNPQSSLTVITATLFLSAPPVLSTSPDRTVCINSTQSFTVGGALTYSWSTGATSSVIVVQTSGNTVYTVTGTAANGCVSTATTSITAYICTGSADILPGVSPINIWPNPNNGDFHISAHNECLVQLYNEAGQLVTSVVLYAGNGYQVNIKELAKGLYFVESKTSDGLMQQKIIVQ